MEHEWTEPQQAAIENLGGSLLVSAAAGSGKTSVLCERIIRLITDEKNGVDADSLLVVTFTNAAAAEMSFRIRRSLELALVEQPDNMEIRRQLFLLGRAQISTIHSFCLSVIRENFNQLDIPLDFTVADPITSQELRQQVLEQLLGALHEDETSGIAELSDLFGRTRTDRDTLALIDQLFEFESNLPFPRSWESSVIEEIESGMPFPQTRCGQFLIHHATTLINAAKVITDSAIELALQDEELIKKYLPALQDDAGLIDKLKHLIEKPSWDEICELLAQHRFARLISATKADNQLQQQVKGLREQVRKILGTKLNDQCFLSTGDIYMRDMQLMLRPLKALFHAVTLFGERYMQQKKERRQFTFEDLERLALNLLADEYGNPSETAIMLSQRYSHILVDEYQDTNENQEMIFRLISRDQNNLFFVGDIKQSIYGFRRADPDIFVRRADEYALSPQGKYPMLIALSHNFRSTTAVIDGINSIFSPVMTRATGGVDYRQPGEFLIASPSAITDGDIGLEVHLLQEDDSDEKDEQTSAIEPAFIADFIKNHLEGQTPVFEGKQSRPCRESDFCILLRSAKNKSGDYRDALQQQGIAVWADSDDSIFSRSEVSVLLALLRIVDNPHRDIDLAAVMLSPLFRFTPDDLFRIKTSAQVKTLYSALLCSEEIEVRQFLFAIREVRTLRNTLSLSSLIQYTADRFSVDILLCAGDDYARSRNNIRLLLEYADSYSSRYGTALGSFLHTCESAAQGKLDIGREFSPPRDAVCITTVHKSKGLEWPFVIVANTAKRINNQDAHIPTMLFDSTLGLGARIHVETPGSSGVYTHKTLSYAALSLNAEQRTLSEEMRILYVALTRARQKVIVTATLSDPWQSSSRWRQRAGTDLNYQVSTSNKWIDWIGLALSASHPDLFSFFDGKGSVSLTIHDEPPASGAAEQVLDQSYDNGIIDSILSRLSFEYDRAPLSLLPSKMSVTELLGARHTFSLYRPVFSNDRLTPAERGTALHTFMQCADLLCASRSFDSELERLINEQYMDEAAAKSIDRSVLDVFFKSELFQRMLSGSIMREYAFIDTITAGVLYPDLPEHLREQPILIQGKADCILIEQDSATLVDYKSDRVDDARELAQLYSGQLSYYRRSIAPRLDLPIQSCLIYSFALGQTIEVWNLSDGELY